MTQNTLPNSRNINNNGALSYSNKARGTHTRVSRVRVATVGKPPFPEKQHRSCPKCKESTSSMKMLTARVGRIEQLVDELAKTTRGLASMSKREDRAQYRFKGLNLTNCTLEELQKLVVTTTNFISSTSRKNSKIDKTLSDITTITTNNNDKGILRTEEPMEDVKIFQKTRDHRPLVLHATNPLKRDAIRHDSGFEESVSSYDGKPSKPLQPENNL